MSDKRIMVEMSEEDFKEVIGSIWDEMRTCNENEIKQFISRLEQSRFEVVERVPDEKYCENFTCTECAFQEFECTGTEIVMLKKVEESE